MKIQDAAAILVPKKIRKQIKYMVCLEYRYKPVMIGFVGGELDQFSITTIIPVNPNGLWQHLNKTIEFLPLRARR